MKIRAYIEAQNGLGWKQPDRSSSSNLLLRAETPPGDTRPGDWMKFLRGPISLP